MPGSVPAAVPVDDFPTLYYRAFAEQRAYIVQVNEYRNGESQQLNQTATSRRRWRVTMRLNPADLATLRTFYNDHPKTVPFWFTAINESVKAARFDGLWNQTTRFGLSEVALDILEIY